ncbi:DNA cytosine methyltransferase [Leucobacter rhizosphaerae]|uniref:Cytosine-specific methyltransferase n=1 Tax=Leucobacter rhizosphaerae TaxID=2932245 RepID=A0ABY4FYX1_9MICO|nr:DNA cytosine methyltransferase [Leucobacter rhizosphaerae]UOQ61505.1 DNA cytosine methyltransferase [Leucobacter rhizosphaerae]
MVKYAVKLERSAPLTLPRHPGAPEDGKFTEWCVAEKEAGRPLAVDLFSGAGGLGAGVEAAGWTVVAAVDHDKAALETHRANFRGQALDVDMSDQAQVQALIEKLRPLGIDLVAGGPPCQPFSRAGRAKIRSLIEEGTRDAVDARKELWRSFIDVVTALQPRAVLMENVPDMAIGDDLIVIREIAEILEQAGYIVDYRLLDAWRHGVPQHRKRFILQARRDGAVPAWPSLSDAGPTVRDAIEDLPSLNDTTGARELPYSGEPTSELAKRLRPSDGSVVIHDHMTRPVRADDREAFALMTSTTLYSDLPERLKRYRSDTFNDKYKRLPWDDLSRTITAHIAKDGYWYIHPGEHRTLTVREAARIQTFPDNFRFAGTRSDAFRQIGNAVPPILGHAVAEMILPLDVPQADVALLPAMRDRLTAWAKEQRESTWWLYPGPEMTAASAVVVALLDIHRLPKEAAASMIDPLRGIQDLSLASLQHIDVQALSKTRKQALRELREMLRGPRVVDWTPLAAASLGTAQRKLFALLRGGNELIVNERVKNVVTMLMDLPEAQTGLHTDIKVALAQLVSGGPEATLRMSALRVITVSEARALIKATSSTNVSAKAAS